MLSKFQFPNPNNIRFRTITKEQFLIFATEAAKKLKWELIPKNESELVFRTPSNWFKWGRTVYVKLEEVQIRENDLDFGTKLFVYCNNKRKAKKLLLEVENAMSALTIDQISAKMSEIESSGGFEAHYVSTDVFVDTRKWWQKFLSLFKAGENYIATPVLLYINVGVFILMLLTNKGELEFNSIRLVSWGGDFSPVTFMEGQWWRLISANFLHVNGFHLTTNMIGLVYVGFLLERYIGSKRLISAYLGIGFISNLFGLFFFPLKVRIGASGGILGLFSLLLVLAPTMLRQKELQKVQVTMAAVYLFYPLFINFMVFDNLSIYASNINHIGHFSGFASGLLLGFAFLKSIKKGEPHLVKIASYSIITIAVFTIFLSTSFYILNRSKLITPVQHSVFFSRKEPISPIFLERIDDMSVTPKAREIYLEKMNRFLIMESMALEVLNVRDKKSENYFNDLKNRGIYYWNENLTLLREFDQMNLPDPLKEKHLLLEQYCELNIKLYELKYLSATEQTDQYDEPIRDYEEEIEKLTWAIRRK